MTSQAAGPHEFQMFDRADPHRWVALPLASALCGMAPSPASLIAARILQGAVATVMAPQVLALVST
jgi:MFS family permease